MIPEEARTIIVTTADCQALGFCTKGVRYGFERHGLDYRSFARHGVPGEVLLAVNDEKALAMVEEALRRTAGHGRGR